MTLRSLALAALLCATPAAAGQLQIIDGDTVRLTSFNTSEDGG
jgi:hypothetical protein